MTGTAHTIQLRGGRRRKGGGAGQLQLLLFVSLISFESIRSLGELLLLLLGEVSLQNLCGIVPHFPLDKNILVRFCQRVPRPRPNTLLGIDQQLLEGHLGAVRREGGRGGGGGTKKQT
jgi:hypothetical protein